jgi:hypothetical protein
LFDLLQAVVAYWVANRLRRQMEQKNQAIAPYPYASLLYRSQTFFFAVKAVLMPLATASIIVLLFVMVCNSQSVTTYTYPPCSTQRTGAALIDETAVAEAAEYGTRITAVNRCSTQGRA